MEEDMRLISTKKFYLMLEDHEDCDGVVLVKNSVSPAASRRSDSFSQDESSDVVKKRLRSPDLESEGYETEISRSIVGRFREASTQAGELSGDSEEVSMNYSATMPKKKSSKSPGIPRRKIEDNAPSAAELEDFFAAAEKYNAKRFAEKYNYDIIKDVPLEGKYQWVRLQP